METLRYSPVDNDRYDALVMVDMIVRLSKSDDGEITYIHLVTGDVIGTYDSINTIEARLNSDS